MFTQIVPITAMALLLAVLLFKLAKADTARASSAPKSALARDGGQGGNWYLLSRDERDAVLAERKAKAKTKA